MSSTNQVRQCNRVRIWQYSPVKPFGQLCQMFTSFFLLDWVRDLLADYVVLIDGTCTIILATILADIYFTLIAGEW